MANSLRRTLLIWLLAPLLVLFSAGTVVVYRLALNYAQAAHDRALSESAYDVVQLVMASLPSGGRIEVPHVAQSILLRNQYDTVYYTVIDSRGQQLAGDGSLRLPPGFALSQAPAYYDTAVAGERVRAIAISLPRASKKYGDLTVLVGETCHMRKILAHDILTGFVVPQAVIILLATILVLFGVRRGLAPLEMIRSSLAKRHQLDLRPVRMLDAPVEVQPLLAEINILLEWLQAQFDAQRRFVADAAHQLRTPLAGLAAQTDFAREQDNPSPTQHALGQIKEVSGRLNHAVNQLLALARNEPGADKGLRLMPLDLNSLAREVTLDWVSRAVSHKLDLGFESEDIPCIVYGDAQRIRELIDNLLDNALRYCPAGSVVTVRVASGGLLEVEDSGPGIPVAERALVFERFHRVLGSGAEGTGLGLSIVKEIAVNHGGSVYVTEGAHGRGAKFCVQFAAIPAVGKQRF